MIVGYVRVSTDKQAELGYSIEAQKSNILRYIKLMNVNNENEIKYIVDDGYSGTNMNRPGLQQLFTLIETHCVKLIVSMDMSRLSRNIVDINKIIKLLNDRKIKLECVNDDVDTLSPTGMLVTNVRTASYTFETEKIRERTNYGLIQKADQGEYPCGGKMPFGYIKNNEHKVELNPLQAEIIEKIFNQVIKRIPIKEICVTLNNEYSDLKMTLTKLRVIIHHDIYSGRFEFKGKTYDDIVPAIVSIKTQEDAKLLVRKHIYKKDNEYIFEGILQCEKCGSFLTSVSAYGRNKNKYYYYSCGKCKRQIGEKAIDKILNSIGMEIAVDDRRIKNIENRYHLLRSKVGNIKDMYEAGAIDVDEYLNAIRPLMPDLNKYEALRGLIVYDELIEQYSLIEHIQKKTFVQENFSIIKINLAQKIITKIIQS